MRSKTVKNYLLVCGVAAHVAGILAVVTLAIVYSDRNFGEVSDRSFGELVGKFQQRFGNDHPAVVAVITRTAGTLGLPTAKSNELIELPTFPGPGYWPAQGAVNSGLKALSYDERGAPKQAKPGIEPPSGVARTIVVADEKAPVGCTQERCSGRRYRAAPGSYHLKGHRVVIGGAGTPDAPIYVRAQRVGTVKIELDTLEGFFVNKPYWVFENLIIRGACKSDSRCEHAFHVVGNGVGTVLRNNELIDFNAALKVNGLRTKNSEQHPDFGLVQNNTIYNTRPRDTGNPTTPLNINSANGWVVSSNFIADFAKGKSDRISYAAFMKGNSSNGIFERNLVVCHWKLPMDGGIRVGLSFGGGGTGKQYCRWADCRAEHTAGIIRNNIITRCPADVGIYLNRSARTQIYGNLLLDNKGIDVRFSPAPRPFTTTSSTAEYSTGKAENIPATTI